MMKPHLDTPQAASSHQSQGQSRVLHTCHLPSSRLPPALTLRVLTMPWPKANSALIPWLPCCSIAQSCLNVSDPTDCSMPGSSVLHYLLEFTQTHVHWVGDATQPSHSLLSPSLPALSLSQHQGLFQWVKSVLCIRWPKYGSFSFSISPSNAYSGLISFKTDWFHLAVPGTLKSLLQHYSSKASIPDSPSEHKAWSSNPVSLNLVLGNNCMCQFPPLEPGGWRSSPCRIAVTSIRNHIEHFL